MRITSTLAVVLGILFGTTGTANAGQWYQSFFCRKQISESSQECPNVSHSVGCQMSLGYAFLDSTCDMYPHYAYYPECHGSYYFRPYNWEHYFQDTALMLGAGHAAPYSVDGMAELKPVSAPDQPVIRVRHRKLPNIEVLLQEPSALPAPPQPAILPSPRRPALGARSSQAQRF